MILLADVFGDGLNSKSRVAIVVDSAASLPADSADYHNLFVVPMSLALDGRSYLDGVDLAPTEFYRLLKQSSTLPTTSAPSPARFLEAFHKASAYADSVLCITVASRFSSSQDAAREATTEASKILPDLNIEVMDSESAAGGEGLIALEAWRASCDGADMEGVLGRAKAISERVKLLAFVDTLYYLWKGGRVPKLAQMGSSLLKLKPVFELAQGEVNNLSRPRTTRRAISRLVDLMHERVASGKVHATVMHADAAEAAEELRGRVEAEFDCAELFVSEFTPVMGAHIGPGLVGVAFWYE